MKELDKADKLMKEGKQGESKAILQSLLSSRPYDAALCQDAIAIYLKGNLFKEAKEIFKVYKESSGKVLNSDFTLEEIENIEQKHEQCIVRTDLGNAKIYKCVPFWQRAGITGPIEALFPIREVQVHSDGLAVKNSRGVRKYNWSEINEAKMIVCLKQSHYVSVNFKKLVLSIKHQRLKLIVTEKNGFNYFENVNSFNNEIQKYLKVKVVKKRFLASDLISTGVFLAVLFLIYLFIKHFNL